MAVATAVKVGSSVVGGALSKRSSDKQAKATERAADVAAQNARLGFDYLQNNQQLQNDYINPGAQANQRVNALLGLGTPAQSEAAQGGFQNFLSQIGYDNELAAGSEAITGSRAARGLLDSGATLKGLQEFGEGLKSQRFGDYLNALSTQGNIGLQGITTIGSAGSSAGATAAPILQQGLTESAALQRQGSAAQQAGFANAIGSVFNSFGKR